MTSWLAISLGLWLGQTPQLTPSVPPDAEAQDPAAIELREAWERALEDSAVTELGGEGESDEFRMPPLEIGTQDSPITVPAVRDPLGEVEDPTAPGIGGAGTDAAAANEAPATAATPRPQPQPQGEVARLRAQVEALQAQLQTQQQESAARSDSLQQELTGMEERAQELERLREERLDLLERAATWMLAADQALAVGELDVGDALDQVDIALADVLQNAEDAGSGQTVVLVENARARIAFVADAVGRRDVHPARQALYNASLELREARSQAFDRAGASIILP